MSPLFRAVNELWRVQEKSTFPEENVLHRKSTLQTTRPKRRLTCRCQLPDHGAQTNQKTSLMFFPPTSTETTLYTCWNDNFIPLFLSYLYIYIYITLYTGSSMLLANIIFYRRIISLHIIIIVIIIIMSLITCHKYHIFTKMCNMNVNLHMAAF